MSRGHQIKPRDTNLLSSQHLTTNINDTKTLTWVTDGDEGTLELDALI